MIERLVSLPKRGSLAELIQIIRYKDTPPLPHQKTELATLVFAEYCYLTSLRFYKSTRRKQCIIQGPHSIEGLSEERHHRVHK